MSHAAYNYYRLLGFAPEQAMELAQNAEPVDMYEQKAETDTASHGGFTQAIGLKDEFKRLVKGN